MRLAAPIGATSAGRLREAAVVVAAVLLAHLWLVSAFVAQLDRTHAARATRGPSTVRQIRMPAQATTTQANAASEAPWDEPTLRRSARRAVSDVAVLRLPPIVAGASTPASQVTGTVDHVAPTSAPAAAAEAIGPGSVATAVPTYATRIAPAFRATYELRKGAKGGSAELLWQPDGNSYELELRGLEAGAEMIGLASRGSFDEAGLAPNRFVDRHRGRERAAVNFDRQRGRITFSAPQVRYPLHAGAQDRLSWMLQLAAIVDADPMRFSVDERITLFVAGVRGDADAWVFSVLGVRWVEVAGGGTVAALHLRREATRPYDLQVDAWLDPGRHHLPVRASLATVPEGYALEMVLRP